MLQHKTNDYVRKPKWNKRTTAKLVKRWKLSCLGLLDTTLCPWSHYGNTEGSRRKVLQRKSWIENIKVRISNIQLTIITENRVRWKSLSAYSPIVTPQQHCAFRACLLTRHGRRMTHTRTHTHTHAHTRTHTHAHPRARTDARTHARAHARTHPRTHTHTPRTPALFVANQFNKMQLSEPETRN